MEISELSHRTRDTRQRTKLGNGYLNELKKKHNAKREQEKLKLEQKIQQIGEDLDES